MCSRLSLMALCFWFLLSLPALWLKFASCLFFSACFFCLWWNHINARFISTWPELSCIWTTLRVFFLWLNLIWIGTHHLCYRDLQCLWLLRTFQLALAIYTLLSLCFDQTTMPHCCLMGDFRHIWRSIQNRIFTQCALQFPWWPLRKKFIQQPAPYRPLPQHLRPPDQRQPQFQQLRLSVPIHQPHHQHITLWTPIIPNVGAYNHLLPRPLQLPWLPNLKRKRTLTMDYQLLQLLQWHLRLEC